jgi:hypothetical protein
MRARAACYVLSAATLVAACAPRAAVPAAMLAAMPAPTAAADSPSATPALAKQRRPRTPPPVPQMPPGWTTYTSTEGRFAVDLPGPPRQQSQTLNTAVGPVQMYTYMHEFAGGARAYMISFNDYPAAMIQRGNSQRMLDGARDGIVRNLDGTVLNERHFNFGRYPARELQIRVPRQHAVVTARVYLVGARLYQTLALSRENDPVGGENTYFLQSFRLTP